MIASIGELLVEFVCVDKDLHHLTPAPYFGPFASGAPGIFIDQAARIAGKALFVGTVGDDAFGRVITDRLQASGVDTRLVSLSPSRPTGTAHVAYNSDGSREFVFNIAASAAGELPDRVPVLLTRGVTLLHVSGSTLGDPDMALQVFAQCKALRAKGISVSIDPNVRPELMTDPGYLDIVHAIIGMATYVLPSDADAALLWPGQDFGIWAPPLIAQGARAVVLKRGDQGCIGLTATDGPLALAAHPVPVIDPTGAGDCFCATFVARMEAGQALSAALRHANAAGALAVTKLGPMEGNSDLPTIAAFLKGS